MPWIQIDDHFDEHPKLQRVGPLGWGVWLAGLAYCNRNLTDGFIPWAKAHHLASFEVVEDDGQIWDIARSSNMAGEDVDADWVIGLLIDAGLWSEVMNGRGRIDGYQVHDYKDWQKSKEQVLSEREAARERMKRHRSSEVRANNEKGSGKVREKFKDPQPQPQKERSKEHSTTPLPPTSTYADVLNGALPKLLSMFQHIDKQFTDGWLRTVLVEAESTVGPLPRDKLGKGLDLALDQVKRKVEAGKVTSPRMFARTLIVQYLMEQRDGRPAA